MRKTIISDTSCLIVLTNIGELDLLRQVYGNIITTLDIEKEYGEPLPEWIAVVEVKDLSRQRLLEFQIDRGESSAIALALETPNSIVILDDAKARKIAEKLELVITGTLGILIKAKLLGYVPSIKPLLAKMKRTDFRLSEELEFVALKEAGEL